jgi:hypothetical protein
VLVISPELVSLGQIVGPKITSEIVLEDIPAVRGGISNVPLIEYVILLHEAQIDFWE